MSDATSISTVFSRVFAGIRQRPDGAEHGEEESTDHIDANATQAASTDQTVGDDAARAGGNPIDDAGKGSLSRRATMSPGRGARGHGSAALDFYKLIRGYVV